MDQYIGRLLDNRYEILEIIGTGGMAVVYKALCHRLNRMVAIKILKDEYFSDEEFRRRFHAEGQAVAMLSHPNIVSVYDVSTTGDADYIVMELVDGITLKQYMEKKGCLNWRETLHFSMQIAKALEHAHSRGIVHRDIKPHNVMILKNGTAKVTDFGIARIMSSTNTLTKEALGSVHYISPEQAKGGRVDNRSDIYSLGVVMYEMMTGRPPYDGESPVAIALKHISGGAVMPSILNPNLPGGLEQIIMKAMAVEPENRYTSATEMLYDMEEFRKNPEILFYQERPAVPVQRARQPVTEGQAARHTPPRTTAERVAGPREPGQRPRQEQGAPVRRPQNTGSRPQQQTGRPQQQGSRPQQPSARSRQEERERDNRNRTKTIAILAAGGAVLLIALIFGISALFKNADKGEVTVDVPRFIGQVYEDINKADYPDFVLVDKDYDYSDEYKKGEIMDQTPKAHTQAKKGSTVEFVVSLGVQTEDMPDLLQMSEENARKVLDQYNLKLKIVVATEPNNDVDEGKVIRTEPAYQSALSEGMTVTLYISEGKTSDKMPDLADKTPAEAMDLLTTYKLDLKFNQKKENSDEVKKDRIVRTEPSAGQEISKGDTVTLWVSTGPEQVKVPQVTGMDLTKALDILDGYDLKAEYDYVESDKPKDQVVSQSVAKGTEVDKNSTITLEVSQGPTEPATEATEPLVYKTVTIKDIPVSEKEVVLSIKKDGVTIYDDLVLEAGSTDCQVALEGRGTAYYDLYIDGALWKSIRVDFN